MILKWRYIKIFLKNTSFSDSYRPNRVLHSVPSVVDVGSNFVPEENDVAKSDKAYGVY